MQATFDLRINSYSSFNGACSELHRLGLLKHELLHIAYFHLTKFFEFQDKKLANIAMDMEINQYIEKEFLPEGGIDINDYPELNLDRRAGTGYYYDALKKAQQQKQQQGSSGCPNFDKLCDAMENNQVTVVISGGSMGEKEVKYLFTVHGKILKTHLKQSKSL